MMLLLKHNTLSSEELIQIERIMRNTKSTPNEERISLHFTLEDKSKSFIYGHVLKLFEEKDLFTSLGITSSAFLDFLIDIDRGYLPNAYHSFMHAIDVTYVLYHIIYEYDISTYLTPVDIVLLFIAGLCHDIGHPGLNNNYQVNMNTDLAKRYDNHSVLESHSCALSLELIDKHHIFDHITTLTVEEAKLKLVKMILATDMIFHYELQENMTNILDIIQQKSPDESLADQLTSSPSSTSSSTSLNDQTTTSPIFSSKNSTTIVSTSTSASSSESSSPLTINTSHSITQNLHGTDSVKTISPEPVILRDIFTDLGNESPLHYFINEIYKHKYHNNNNNDHRHCHPQQNHKSILVSPSPSHPTSLPPTNATAATVATATDSESNDSPSSIDNASSPYSCLNNNKRRKHSGNKKVTIVSPPSLSPPPQEASDKNTSWKNNNEDGMILNDEERLILCQILLHGADISNPLRPWPICFEWSKRVCTEFFHQGDMERQHGLQVSPNMDHRRTDQNTVGLQFSDFVVSPYFEIFSALFPKADVLCASLKSNRLQWLRKIEEDQVSSSVSANENSISVKSGRKGKAGKIHVGDVDDDEEEEEYYGSIPAPFVPNGTNIINPTGRRVSVAAGMAVIPNQLEEKIIGSGKRQRTYLGVRSASYADIIHPSRSMSISLDELEKHRRKSEQPNILRSSLTPI
ncbi:hypothetical protein BJ944DRAFT_46190 [Cunninghamella echinulata]|nr:hypothetical protein BJ944DRAFT_46190 [Cunninghamella echinulata]